MFKAEQSDTNGRHSAPFLPGSSQIGAAMKIDELVLTTMQYGKTRHDLPGGKSPLAASEDGGACSKQSTGQCGCHAFIEHKLK